MPKITFISHDGEEYTVEAESGSSVMQAATSNGVPGVDGDCGGALACATCHVFVTDSWADRLPQPREGKEMEMLELLDGYTPTSRLSCQIVITDALDGLVLKMPRGQH
jgi:ferredoxin, 2Fe-2S